MKKKLRNTKNGFSTIGKVKDKVLKEGFFSLNDLEWKIQDKIWRKTCFKEEHNISLTGKIKPKKIVIDGEIYYLNFIW